MGQFADAEYVKARSRLPSIQDMEVDDIEDLLIIPVERILEEEYFLQLDTEGDPALWAARFDTYPHLREEFQRDMKISTVLLCDRLEHNPHGHVSQSVRNASVVFGKNMPTEIGALLNRWGQRGPLSARVFR